MNVLLIAAVCAVGGYYLPWWILVVALVVLAVLFVRFKQADNDSETVQFLFGLAVFIGLCIGNVVDLFMHHHPQFLFS